MAGFFERGHIKRHLVCACRAPGHVLDRRPNHALQFLRFGRLAHFVPVAQTSLIGRCIKKARAFVSATTTSNRRCFSHKPSRSICSSLLRRLKKLNKASIGLAGSHRATALSFTFWFSRKAAWICARVSYVAALAPRIVRTFFIILGKHIGDK